MAKVNIYLQDDTLAFAKAAAAQANMSLSAWFAQLARAENERTTSVSLGALLDELDRTYGPPDDSLDFLLDQRTRYADLGEDAPRESFE